MGCDRDGLVRHAWLVLALFGIAAIAGVLGPTVALDWQIGVALALVISVGIGHGAIDHVTAAPVLRRRLGRGYLPIFLAGYLGAAALVIFAWMHQPAAALVGFLALSVLHFGLSDTEISRGRPMRIDAEAIARGALPIALPGVLHAGEITPVYEVLLLDAGRLSEHVVQRMSLAVALGAIVILALVLFREAPDENQVSWRDGTRGLRAGVLVAACACLLFCPPILGFALVFCGWHAAREILDLASRESAVTLGRRIRAFAGRAAPFWAVAAAGFIAALALAGSHASWHEEARVLFIGLAALTVPHMIVENGLGPAARVIRWSSSRSRWHS